MPNRTIYIPQHLCDHLDREKNKSGIVSMLLAGHYASTKPGPAMPTIERSVQEKQEYEEKLKRLAALRENGYVMKASELESSHSSEAFEQNIYPLEEAA
jgi:hypothetical protein